MLSRRAAFSLATAVVLAISLGIKALMPNNTSTLDFERYRRELAALLVAQGFAVGIEVRNFGGDVVVATRGSCRLKLRTEDTVAGLTVFKYSVPDLPLLNYRFRGSYSKSFPSGTFELRSRLQWLGLRYGLVRAVERPLLIAANKGCDMAMIDFGPQLLFLKKA